jgi:hypothetical protein
MVENQANEELLEHIIKVNEYIEVSFKIPRVMTPLKMMGLIEVWKRYFNLSHIPIVDEQAEEPATEQVEEPKAEVVKTEPPVVKEPKIDTTIVPPIGGRIDEIFTEEMKKVLVELKNKGVDYDVIADDINKRFGSNISTTQVIRKVSNMKTRGQWPK